MTWSNGVRQVHRWLPIAFTVTVVSIFVAVGFGSSPALLFYLPLAPLSLFLPTGLYLFVLPYLGRRKTERTPKWSTAKGEPRRANPVITSSRNRGMPWRLQMSRRRTR